MSMKEWDNESIRAYTNIIKEYAKQIIVAETRSKAIEERKDKWLNDFIDGKPVMQFDKFVYSRGN